MSEDFEINKLTWMKPEDLVVGNLYIYTESNEIPYFLKYIESQCEGYYRFKVVKSGELMVIHESAFHSLNEEAVTPLRKPEEISITLTEEEFLQAISSLGYDLEGYTLNYSHIKLSLTSDTIGAV